MNLAGRLGVIAAAFMAAYMLFNAIDAWTEPQAFALRLGLPASTAEAADWVGVYSLRAAFIGLLLSGLIVARQWRALFLVAIAALVMPVGDAYLTYNVGAPAYLRHMAIAAFVAVSALLLAQAARTGGR